MAGIKDSKPLAIVDSNILIYAMLKDYPNREKHQKCLSLLELGLKGELNHILAINAIIIVEVFTVLRKLLNDVEAETRINTLLSSRRLAYLSISKEACQIAVRWAKKTNVPVNDALIAASMLDNSRLIYTADEDHFKKLEEDIIICNPTV